MFCGFGHWIGTLLTHIFLRMVPFSALYLSECQTRLGAMQRDLLLSGLAVVTFNYSYIDSVADGPAVERFKTQE